MDGHVYADFCLGDTGAMTGHAPAAVAGTVAAQAGRAITTMLPSADAPVVGEAMSKRFGLPLWQMTLSATDANRFAIRFAREITGRPRILIFNWCYHGSVDETFAVLREGRVVARPGNVGQPVELERTTRRYGTVLIIDETHTLSTGYGGYTREYGLDPDMLTVGKPIGGGVPAGAFGMTREVAERAFARPDADFVDTGGVGGTLAGNALSATPVQAPGTEEPGERG